MKLDSEQGKVGLGPAFGAFTAFSGTAVAPSHARGRVRRKWVVVPPLLYLVLSILSVGRFALAGPGGGTIGAGPDVQVFLWGLRWWPYALLHGFDPLISHVVWTPYGSSILWTTTVPLLSVLAAPVTLAFGLAVAWNALCVLAPALSAWSAYGLCLELTADQRASIVGGLLFGFSGYELAEGMAHLQLTMVALVPLAVRVLVRYGRGCLDGPGLAWRLGAIAAAEFLISPEVLASLLLMGAVAVTAGLMLFAELRARLLAGLGWGMTGLLAAGVICAPELMQMLRTMPAGSLNPISSYSTDLLNLVVPTHVDALSGSWSAPIAAGFTGNLAEQTGYLGAPLVLIVVAFWWTNRRAPAVRLLAALTAAALILSFGPQLHLRGRALISMPYASLWGLPGFRDALPARFALYVALGAAVTAALWLSQGHRRAGGWRWATVAVALVCLAPATSQQLWWRPSPAWIVHDDLARIVPRGDTVVWLPFWSLDDRGLYAQAVAGFRFRLDDRWLQVVPTRYRTVSNSAALDSAVSEPGSLPRLERALCALKADYAIEQHSSARNSSLAGAHLKPIRDDGLLVYRLPAGICRHA